MLLFELSMPNVGSWNNRWSGERDYYAVSRRDYDVDKKLLPEIIDKSFFYNFGDGWTACVKVSKITHAESKKILKNSKGFCGYEWMVNSICKYGEIIDPETRKKKELEKLDQILK